MNAQHKDKGFTIIEVVLVLAIAGLIFLMVFIALPALQRGQRDQARKNDVSTVASAVNTFKSGNRGSFGTVGATGNGNLNTTNIRRFIDRLDQYEVTGVSVNTNGAVAAKTITHTNLEGIVVVAGSKCPTAMPAPGATSIALIAGTARTAAVIGLLENNGNATQRAFFCQDV